MQIPLHLLLFVFIFAHLTTESTANLGTQTQVKNRQISDEAQELVNVLAEGLKSVEECAMQKNIIFFKQEDKKYAMKKVALVKLFEVANSRRIVSQVVTYNKSQIDRIPICASNLVSKVNNSYMMRMIPGFQHYNEAKLKKELSEIEHDLLPITIEDFIIENEVPTNVNVERKNENDEKNDQKREKEKVEIKPTEQSEKFDQLAFIIGQSLIAVEQCKNTNFEIFQKKDSKMMPVENLKALFEKENKIDQTTAKCPFHVLVPHIAIPAFKEYWSDMPDVIKGLNQSKWINAWHGVYGKKIPLNLFEKMLNGFENNELIIKDEKLKNQIEEIHLNQIGSQTDETHQNSSIENEETNENLRADVLDKTNVPESLVDENFSDNDGTEYAEDVVDVKGLSPSKKSKIVTGSLSDEPKDKNKIGQQPYSLLGHGNEGGIEETNPAQININAENLNTKIQPKTPQNAKPTLATDSVTNVFQFGSGSNSALFKKQQAINSLDANIEEGENLNEAISPRQNGQFGKSSSMNERDANKKNDNNQRKRAKKSGKLSDSRPSSPRNTRSGGQSQQLTSLTSFNGDSPRNAGNEAAKKELTKNRSGKQLTSVPLFNANSQGNSGNEKENDSGKRHGNADSSPSASTHDKGDKNINVHSINVDDDESKKSEKNVGRVMPSNVNSSHINHGNLESGKLPSNLPRAMSSSSPISAGSGNGKPLTNISSFNSDLLRNGANENMLPEHHANEFSSKPDSSHKNVGENVHSKIGNQEGTIPKSNSPRGTASNSPLKSANETEKNELKKTRSPKQPTPVPSFKTGSPRSVGNGKQNVLPNYRDRKTAAQIPYKKTSKNDNLNQGSNEGETMSLNSETQPVSPGNKEAKKEFSKSESKKELMSKSSFNKADSPRNQEITGKHDNGTPMHLEGHIGSKIPANGNSLQGNDRNIETQLAPASPAGKNGKTSPKFQLKRPPALNLAELTSTSPEVAKSQNSAYLTPESEHSPLNSPRKGKNSIEPKITSPRNIPEQANLNHEIESKKANFPSIHGNLETVEPARILGSQGTSKGQMAKVPSTIYHNEHGSGISSPKENFQDETSLDRELLKGLNHLEENQLGKQTQMEQSNGNHSLKNISDGKTRELKEAHLERTHSKEIPSKGTNMVQSPLEVPLSPVNHRKEHIEEDGKIRSPMNLNKQNDGIFGNSDALDKIDQQTHLNADRVADRAKSIANKEINDKIVIPAIMHKKPESPTEIEATKSMIDGNAIEKDKMPSSSKLETEIPTNGIVFYGNAKKDVEEKISRPNEVENLEKHNAVDIDENGKSASIIDETPNDEKSTKENRSESIINKSDNGIASSLNAEFHNLDAKTVNVTKGNAVELNTSKIHTSSNGDAEVHTEEIQSAGIHKNELERVKNENILSAKTKTALEENIILARKEGNIVKDDGQLEPGVTIFYVVSRKNDQKMPRNVAAFGISPSLKGENNTVLNNKNGDWRDCAKMLDDKSKSNRIKVNWNDCGITDAFWKSADVPILQLRLLVEQEQQSQQMGKSRKKNSKSRPNQNVVVDFSTEMTNLEGAEKVQLPAEMRKLVAGGNAVEIDITDGKPKIKFIENEEKSNKTA